jgi:hypothetical protein
VLLRRTLPSYAVVPLFAALIAAAAVIGADARWLAAIGAIVARGTLPHSLPFATAPTSGWHDVPALAELVFHWLHAAFGDRGLELLNVIGVATGFGVLVVALRRQGATAAAVTLVGLVVFVGSLPEIGAVRNGLFSLALFPVLLWLIEDERADLRLVVPLFALWSNLHGAVLVGCGVLWLHVLVARRRAIPTAALATLALCATPALWYTPAYYWTVSTNEAARRGVELWAPLGLRPFDIVLVLAAVALAVLARRRFRLWELVTAAVLAAATIRAARYGEWLILLLAFPAARAVRLTVPARVPVLVVPLFAIAIVLGLARTPYDAGSRRLAAEAARARVPVLADAVLAEQVELAGGLVWVADPIDAFRRRDQALYLEWIEGRASGRAALDHARLVLVSPTSKAGKASARDPRLVRIGRDTRAVLYRVRGR